MKLTGTAYRWRWLATMACCVAGVSCTSIESRHHQTYDSIDSGDGIPVMLPKLGAELTRTVEGGKSNFQVKLVRQPDPKQIWTIRGAPVITSDLDLTINLDDDGVLTSTEATTTDRAVATVTALGSLAAALLPFLDEGKDPILELLEAEIASTCIEANGRNTEHSEGGKKLDEQVGILLNPNYKSLFYPQTTADSEILAAALTVRVKGEKECLMLIKHEITRKIGELEDQHKRENDEEIKKNNDPELIKKHEQEFQSNSKTLRELSDLIKTILEQNLKQRKARFVLQVKQQLELATLELELAGQKPSPEAKKLRENLAALVGKSELLVRLDELQRQLNVFPRKASGSASAYSAYRDARLEFIALRDEFDARVGQALAPLKPSVPKGFVGRAVPIVSASCIIKNADQADFLLDKNCVTDSPIPGFIVVLRNGMNAEELEK